MDAADLVRMGCTVNLRTQLYWARSQPTRDPFERLVLLELVALADGRRSVTCSSALLSGLVHLSALRTESILERLERRGCLWREQDAQGGCRIVLAFPPPDGEIAPQGAHVRAREDG